MDKLIINGGNTISGKIEVSGAKNAALPILMSTILTDGQHSFRNVPALADINSTLSLLGRIGCPSLVEEPDGLGDVLKVEIDASRIAFSEAPYDLVRRMRASVLSLGPLLARTGKAKVSLPGGCAIGVRPIDQHLKGLEALGCEFVVEKGYILGKVDQLKGAEINLDVPTVTGTENILMAATLADGITSINNAACEPEIVNLAQFLNSMGARISGAGSSQIIIDGVPALRAARSPFEIMGDRIEAGTYMLAASMIGQDVEIAKAPVEHLTMLCDLLRRAGAEITIEGTSIFVSAPDKLKPVDISTQPHPGFPTDMQAQWVAAMTLASGTTIVRENIFENRFMHVPELTRMGADITINGNVATVRGVSELEGATVMATDLRASASLVMAGLVAKGTTEVLRIYHLDRGYSKIERKLSRVGADIRRA